MIKDYRVYEFTPRESAFGFLEGMLLNAVAAILFYDSFLAMIPGMLLVVLF